MSGLATARGLWILLPAYNEEASLDVLVARLSEELGKGVTPYRIVVVDDGSRDETPRILDRLRATYPLEVVTHPINRGLGETERDGFEYIAARCAADDVVVRLDCDDTHEPAYVQTLVAKLDEGFDVVNTSRFQPGGGQRGVTAYRALISRLANIFMKVVFGMRETRDFSCGFRAYRGRVLQDAIAVFGNGFIQLKGLGFTSTLETIVKLHLLGCRMAEVPFVLRYDQKKSESKMVSSVTTVGYLLMALFYHWPFGGWRAQYRGLRHAYQQDPDAGVARFNRRPRHGIVSRIGT